LRFIVAIISFVIAFLMISYGIAQRTILAEPDHVAATTDVASSATITVIDGEVLNAIDGRQKIAVSGSETIFAAYGRTTDVLAWVGETGYNRIGLDEEDSALTSKYVPGTGITVPDPHGSDLWLAEYTREKELTFVVNVPRDVSIIILSDGTAPAPGHVTITWPVDNRTPWSGPLIVGGVLLLLLGLGLYLWALSHLRKARGPRRKPPRMPKPPRRLKYKPAKRKAVTAGKSGRRSSRHMTAVLPVVLAGTLALSGCTAESWPEFLGGSAAVAPSTAATEEPATPTIEKQPAVTVRQLESIVTRISVAAAQADADRDVALLETRFVGPALDLRKANYAIRGADRSYDPPRPIPNGDIKVALPQQNESWPRTVFTVVQDPEDDTLPPTALMLIQESPRENYKVVYAVALEASAPTLRTAAAEVGTQRLNPDVKVLALPPNALAAAYGDILLKGPESEFYDRFDLENDSLEKSIGFDAKAKRKKSLPKIASMAFASSVGDAEVIAMASNDSGAIVAAYLTETETVKPVEPGAVVNAEGAVKSLSKVSSTTKGTVATYGDQLLFYVPPLTSDAKIVLIGWSSALIAAKEL
jgi:hypothetical protein